MVKSKVNGAKRSAFIFCLLIKLIIFLVILFTLSIFFLPDPFDDKDHMNLDMGEGGGLGERGEQWTEVLSWEPRAFIYHNFLSKEECQYLIDMGRPNLKRTKIFGDDGAGIQSSIRTSSGKSISRGENEVIKDREKRIADFTFIPVEHGECLQILHYDVGQKYEPHLDAFEDEKNIKAWGLRVATLLMYLSDVEEGGETVFPNADVGNSNSNPGVHELSECAKDGMAVKPKLGDALLFWNTRPDATVDPMSLHGSCPVITGKSGHLPSGWMLNNLICHLYTPRLRFKIVFFVVIFILLVENSF